MNNLKELYESKVESSIKEKDVNMNRPDVTAANRIKAIFDDDPYITTTYVNAENGKPAKLILDVHSIGKAAALKHILPKRYEFGGMKLDIEVNDTSTNINEDIIKAAFENNPHFHKYETIRNELTGNEYHLCIFKKEVIQFPNDNGGSLHGTESRLMEDLCREMLSENTGNLLYSTDDESK